MPVSDLLEKSRVIRQAPGERCYHIFYQIYSGQIPGLKEKLLLDQELRYYHAVSQAELTIDGVDDKEEMKLADVKIFFALLLQLKHTVVLIVGILRYLGIHSGRKNGCV